jgi:DNA mismatch endonuclease, patch repair protein
VTDVFSREKRSKIMSNVKDRDTKPELIVRSMIHSMGFRFRLRNKKLPGNPDLVLSRHGKVVFVNGCFWHGHNGCRKAARPKSNSDFWNKKLNGNVERDKLNIGELEQLGWKVLVVWECETKEPLSLYEKLENFMR